MSLASLSGTAPGAAAAAKSGPGRRQHRAVPVRAAEGRGQGRAAPINWINTDDSPHQVTVQGQSELRSPVLLKGQSTQIAFNDVGTYDYICGLHPTMRGTIEVSK